MNNQSQNRLDQLFDLASKEAPKTPYSEVEKAFVSATSVGLFALLIKWFVGASKITKVGIMVSTITAVSVGVAVMVNPTEKQEPIKSENKGVPVVVEKKDEKAPEVDDQVVLNDSWEVGELERKELKPIKELFEVSFSLKPLKTIKLDPKIELTQIEEVKSLYLDEQDMYFFNITEKTSEEEIKEIQEKAEKAGIVFAYKVRYRKGIIKKLTIAMLILDEGITRAKKEKVMTLNSSSFSISFGWQVDQNGTAIDLLDSENLDQSELIDSIEDWVEDLVDDLEVFANDSLELILEDFEASAERLASHSEKLALEIEKSLENDLEHTEVVLDEWQAEVERLTKEITNTYNEESFSKLSLSELKKELEKLEVEIEKQMEGLSKKLSD